MKKSELRQIIREEVSKVMNENNEYDEVNETRLKIRKTNNKNAPTGYVNTKLLDDLVSQIGPHIGYSDWKNRVNLDISDHKRIIQLIAKYLADSGPLQPDRIDFF